MRPSRTLSVLLPTRNEKDTESQVIFWVQTPIGYLPRALNTTPTR